MPRRLPLVVALLLAGCCRDAAACPQNTAAVRVYVDAPEEVEVVGASTTWSCEALDAEALCRPATVADGTYALEVRRAGAPVATAELTVRTTPAPPYSCDCETPSGEVEVELDAPPAPDAGAQDGG